MSKDPIGLVFGVLTLLLVGSCGPDEAETGNYRDNSGRICKAETTRESRRASCDATPVPTNGCSAGEGTPCFTVTRDTVTHHLRNCAACCNGDTAREPISVDCKLITCRTSVDCLFPRAYCDNSFCYMLPSTASGGAGSG